MFPAYLEDLDLCGVRGADVETFQIGLKHPLHAQPETLVSSLSPPPCQGHLQALVTLLTNPHITPESTWPWPTPPTPSLRLTRRLMDMVATFCSTTYCTSLWGQRGHHDQWGRVRRPQQIPVNTGQDPPRLVPPGCCYPVSGLGHLKKASNLMSPQRSAFWGSLTGSWSSPWVPTTGVEG